MESAFGVDHGIEKSFGGAAKELAGYARLQGKAAKGGYKLSRAHNKKALSEAGYPTKPVANFKASFKAGFRGQAAQYRQGQNAAMRTGRARTRADIAAMASRRQT